MSRSGLTVTDNSTPANAASMENYPDGLLDYKYLTGNSAGTTTTNVPLQCLAVPLRANRMIRVTAWGLMSLDATGVSAGNGVQARLQQDGVDLIREDYAVDHWTTPALNAALEGKRKFRIEWTLATGAAITSDFQLVCGVSGSGGTEQLQGVASPAYLGVEDVAPLFTST